MTRSAIVLGGAETVRAEFEKALVLRPSAFIIGVNDGSTVYPTPIIFSMHAKRLKYWRELRDYQWPDTPYEVHACGTDDGRNRRLHPWVDRWWEAGVAHAGTSGWAAARLARQLGYDDIILCGVPITSSVRHVRRKLDGRNAWMRIDGIQDRYRAAIEGDTAMHPYVRSMGGWTRDLLGAPST